MTRVVLFLLGRKGYELARAAFSPNLISVIDHVVIGEDRNIDDDYSVQIAALCKRCQILHYTRGSYQYGANSGTVVIAAGWRWLIDACDQRVIVLHDSLLPKYRGFNPLVTALLNRDEYLGVTAIWATEEFDRGDIIAAERVRVQYPLTITAAIEAVAGLYHVLGTTLLGKIVTGTEIPAIAQDEASASYSVWRDDDDYRIDWRESSAEILHFINCVGSPYKGASTMIDGALVRILEADVWPDVTIANRHPGKVLFLDDGKPVVICGDGLLKIVSARDAAGHDVLPLPRLRVRFC